MKSSLWLGVALLAGACAPLPKQQQEPVPRPTVVIEEDPLWRTVASPTDASRIDHLDEAWEAGLAEARGQGFSRAIQAEGALLQRDGALPRPELTPGSYRCRTVKLGSISGRGRAFSTHKSFFCYVAVDDDNLLTIVKQTGSERPAGRFYPDMNVHKLVFLGALSLNGEEALVPYGAKENRDLAGVLERIGPFRFRIVVPWPRQESKLDVIELVPDPH